ncbi:MAG: ComEC/Rec2 family competence protein [Hyphomicrobiaceae bacterium]
MTDLFIGGRLDEVRVTRPRPEAPADEQGVFDRRGDPGKVVAASRAGSAVSGIRGILDRLDALLDAERDRQVLWLPVLFGLGIGLYFAMPVEPTMAFAGAAILAALALRLIVRRGALAVALSAALVSLALGFAAAKVRTAMVAGPVLDQATRVVAITGWVERIEARRPKGFRLLLRVATVEGLAAEATPERVRVRAAFDTVDVQPGDAVTVKGKLFPPPAPERPGGYDFARLAWFDSIGATGFLIEPPAPASLDPPPWYRMPRLALERLRLLVSARIRAVLPGETGAVTDALVTGERGRISEATDQALRDAGLSHVLAISGANMAIMAGALFGFVRAFLALFPPLVLRFPIKKWAALAGFVGAAFCLILSGADSPAARAFVMIALMLLAILLDRPAVSLRNLALAALVLLALEPETLLDVGFQMSFAAVVALITVFEWVVSLRRNMPSRGRPVGALAAAARLTGRFLAVTFFSTIVASLAVAPLAVYQFHKLAQLGLIANMIVAPLFAFYIMPLVVVALVALPFGIEAMPLILLEKGVAFMIAVAEWAASLTGPALSVPEIGGPALALMMLGGLWWALWLRPWRLLGLAGIAAGLILAVAGGRPDILIASDAKVIAARAADGTLSALPVYGNSFELADWLAADGDARDLKVVAKSKSFVCDPAGCTTSVKGRLVAIAETPEALAEDCRRAEILIVRFALERPCRSPRLVLDLTRLERDGGHRLYLSRSGRIAIETVAAHRGRRPWTAVAPDAAEVDTEISGADGQNVYQPAASTE